MAIRFSYSNDFDFFWKKIAYSLYFFAFFGGGFLAYEVHQKYNIPVGLLVTLWILTVGIILFVFYYFNYLPTKWYVKSKFGIEINRSESKYLAGIFSVPTSGKHNWYPLDEIKNIPFSQRKEALFEIASSILRYPYDSNQEK